MRGLFALLLLLVAQSASAAGVHWQEASPTKAFSAAKAQGKPILLDVYATWCGPCQAMDAKVFARADVAKALGATFVTVRVDGEKGEGPALVERYHVVGYPTYLILSPEGAELDRIFGELPAEEFVATALDRAKGHGTLAARAKELEARPFDVPLAAEVGFRAVVRGDEVLAKRAYARLFRLADALVAQRSPGPRERTLASLGTASSSIRSALSALTTKDDEQLRAQLDAELPKALFALGKFLHLRGRKEPKEAIAYFDEARRAYPKSPEATAALYELAVAHVKLGQPDRALASLRAYLQAKGDAGANAFAWFCHQQGVFRAEGIAVAEAALAKDPAQDGLWDTLAELYFAAGRTVDARRAVDEALHRQPDNPYYRRQQQRFSAK